MDYIAYLHKDSKSDYGVSFPDFPGCVTAGKTLEDARRKAAEALALHLKGMMEDRQAIPAPSTVDDIANDPAAKQAVAFLVPANLEKTVRVNITARESQIEKIDRLARQAGLTRSAYVVQSANRKHRGPVFTVLSPRDRLAKEKVEIVASVSFAVIPKHGEGSACALCRVPHPSFPRVRFLTLPLILWVPRPSISEGRGFSDSPDVASAETRCFGNN